MTLQNTQCVKTDNTMNVFTAAAVLKGNHENMCLQKIKL